MSYKNLHLNQKQLPEYIKAFLGNSGISLASIESLNDTRHRFKLSNGNFFDAFYNNNGTTTLQATIGKPESHNLNHEICGHIKDNCCVGIDETEFSIKISNDIFNKIIDEIKDNIYCKSSDNTDLNKGLGIKWTLNGKQGDKVTVLFYNTGTMVVQGRPIVMFAIVLNTIVEKTGLAVLNNIDIADTRTDVGVFLDAADSKFKAMMPNTYGKISNEFKNNIQQAVLDYEFDGLKVDWTSLVFPAIRAIEWQLCIIFDKNGIPIRFMENNKLIKKFKQFIFDQVTQKHKLKSNYAALCNTKEINTIESLYWLYTQYRLPFSHAGDIISGVDQTRTINTKEDAKVLIKEILDTIDKYYV